MRDAALPVALMAAGLALVLSACFGGDDARVAPTPEPTTSPTAVAVTDQAVGLTLEKLVFHDSATASSAGRACLVDAARSSGLSEEAMAYLVDTNSDDHGAVTHRLREAHRDDAAILVSPKLRTEFDTCVDTEILPESGQGSTTSYQPPAQPVMPKAGRPDLSPTVRLRKGEQITAPTRLTKGLVAVFDSFALDDKQKKAHAAAGECLSTAVFDAGFGQETLRLLASGPRIAQGSIAEQLPKKDRAIWKSPKFVEALNACMARM